MVCRISVPITQSIPSGEKGALKYKSGDTVSKTRVFLCLRFGLVKRENEPPK